MFGLFKKRQELPKIDPGSASEQSLRAVLPRAERQNSYKEIHVTTNTGYKLRGIVVDHSDTGMRVRFQSIETLTPTVKVVVPGLKIRGNAELVWQDATDIGLRLIPEGNESSFDFP
ncbi:MAG: hypothetical protein CMK06_12255 [Ponticaulis sp.]|nr:hypothetical protein [Ponticaulis sp.]|tara:strand:- start:19243 stop:19590 length:348 start_codon:yes stop_codon:yes gene_type:complete